MTDPATSEAAEVLWTPDPDRARNTAIAEFARWVGEHRGVKLDELDYAALHEWSVRRPRRVLVGGRRVPRGDLPRPADRDPGLPGHARRAVVPRRHAELRRARAHPRPRPGRRRRRDRVRPRGRADRAPSPTPSCATLVGPGPGRAGGRRGGPRGPGGRAGPELRGDAGHVPGRRVAWGRSGRPARRTSGPARCTTGSPRSSRRCCWPWTATATAASGSTSARTVAALRGQLPTVHTTVLVGYLDPDASLDGTVPWAEFTANPGRWSSSRCRSTIRCGCCTRRAPPGCPRGSCTGTAGSCWST